MDVYENCPQIAAEHFVLRQVKMGDWEDLLKVYSDLAAVPVFNSDNCTGDFYITTEADMKNTIDFWLREYAQRYYVRWSIVDRKTDCAIGTVELFHRTAEDFYNHVGLLRLDLRSDFEKEDAITDILSALFGSAYAWFECDVMVTKIPKCAKVRYAALEKMGFRYSAELLYGHDGRTYGDYYIRVKD